MNGLVLFSLVFLGGLSPISYANREPTQAVPPANLFEQGRRAFESGKFSRGLDLLARVIDQTGDSTLKNKAYYYQGMILFELGYYYSSYISFRNVLLTADDGNREVYEKAIKNAVTITERMGMVDKVGKVLDNLPSNFISPQVADMAHYSMGVYHLGFGTADKAASYFKSVPPQSVFYPKALFHLGILATRRKDYRESIFYFDKVLDLGRGRRGLQSTTELARLNLARSVYSSGDMERSIELYSQFVSSSPYWLTILLEASWPLMRVSDTTVSLGNLHTVLSPFYREDLVGEGYILRATVLFSLCKYEEMKETLSQFFSIYDPVVRAMQQETQQLGSPESFFRAYVTQRGLNRAFTNYVKRDEGVNNLIKVMDLLRDERRNIARYSRNEQIRRISNTLEETERALMMQVGRILERLHKRKYAEVIDQREQANYLKVEIVTGEKELIEKQKGLPPKRVVDVETTIAPGYHFWRFQGEYWDDELGSFVYTTESSCVN